MKNTRKKTIKMSVITNSLLNASEVDISNGYSLIKPIGIPIGDFLNMAFSLSVLKKLLPTVYDFSKIEDDEDKKEIIEHIFFSQEPPVMEKSYNYAVYFNEELYDSFLCGDINYCPLLTSGSGSSHWWLYRSEDGMLWKVVSPSNSSMLKGDNFYVQDYFTKMKFLQTTRTKIIHELENLVSYKKGELTEEPIYDPLHDPNYTNKQIVTLDNFQSIVATNHMSIKRKSHEKDTTFFKKGTIRGSIMGKRIDNCGRTVAGPISDIVEIERICGGMAHYERKEFVRRNIMEKPVFEPIKSLSPSSPLSKINGINCPQNSPIIVNGDGGNVSDDDYEDLDFLKSSEK